ncbi:MAG: hypothetical protein PHS45_04955 [Bacilli bacterium]|nr:hypothetical protein [Bacilli bacterium]
MNNKKIKLTKEQQSKMISFFIKTSIPRMIKEKSQLKASATDE